MADEVNLSTNEPIDHAEFMRRVETERLGLDRQRLELEQYRSSLDHSNAYLDRWKMDVVDRRRVQMNIAHSASEFGKFTLRSIFLLNGGAMIALPAFGQLINKVDPALLSTSLAWFVGGLSAVTIAMLLGYFSLSESGESWRYAMEGSAASLNQEQASEKEKPNFDEEISTSEADRVRCANIAHTLEVAAIVFATTGLVAFIMGAFSGASMLSG